MAKGLFEKVIERAVLNAAGVWGRKAANTLADKAQDKIEKTKVAQKTKKRVTTDETDEAPLEEEELEMIQ